MKELSPGVKHLIVPQLEHFSNGVKQNEADASCTPVSDEENQETQNPQVVEVPSTSAYGSIIIAALGIICVIVSAINIRLWLNNNCRTWNYLCNSISICNKKNGKTRKITYKKLFTLYSKKVFYFFKH